MNSISFKKTVKGTLDGVIEKVTKELATEGFGVLTRIDFHLKMKEKLGKTVPPTVVLGACNPGLVYEAYCRTTDVTAVIPCNAVVRELSPGEYSVELVRPSAMMQILGDPSLTSAAEQAESGLRRVLERLG